MFRYLMKELDGWGVEMPKWPITLGLSVIKICLDGVREHTKQAQESSLSETELGALFAE